MDRLGHAVAVEAAVEATAGNASLLASANISQTADGDVTAGGTLDVEAAAGSITMSDGAVSDVTGNVRYLAAGDITVGSIAETNVRENSGGSIIDGPLGDCLVVIEETALGSRIVASDPVSNMGETAEVLAREFDVSREEQDAFALRSHRRAAAAWALSASI